MHHFGKSIWTPTDSANNSHCGLYIHGYELGLTALGILPAPILSKSCKSSSSKRSQSETLSKPSSVPLDESEAEIKRLQFLLADKMELIEQLEHKHALSERTWKSKLQQQQSLMDDLQDDHRRELKSLHRQCNTLKAVVEDQQKEIISLKSGMKSVRSRSKSKDQDSWLHRNESPKEEDQNSSENTIDLQSVLKQLESMQNSMRLKDREIWTLRAKLNKSIIAPPGLTGLSSYSTASSVSTISPLSASTAFSGSSSTSFSGISAVSPSSGQPIKERQYVPSKPAEYVEHQKEEEKKMELKEKSVLPSYRLMAMDPVQREMELLFGRNKRQYVLEMCKISGYTTTCQTVNIPKVIKSKGGRLRSKSEWKCIIEIGLIGVKAESVADSKKKAIKECYEKCAELIRKQEM